MCQPVQQYKHHVVRSIARSGVSPGGAHSDGQHWAKQHGQQQLARDLEVEHAVMGQRCRPQSFGEVQRCYPLYFVPHTQYSCSWASLTDQLVRKFKERFGY